jgi:hypothetical protein
MDTFEQARTKLVNAVLSAELDLKDSVLNSLDDAFYAPFDLNEQFVLRRLAGEISTSYYEQEVLQRQSLQPT